MHTRLVRVGNSRGVRIPKPLLEEAGLDGDVRLRVVRSGIVIEPARPARAGWSEAARALGRSAEAGLLDEPTPTSFDEDEWVWE